MSYASGSSSTGKALKMTISMNAGFRFAGETVSPTFPVIERIKKKFEVNDYYAQEYYDYCMHKFAKYPNTYKNMNGEDLMETCYKFIRTLRTVNPDEEDLPAPRKMDSLHQHQSSPLTKRYSEYHVKYGENQKLYPRIKDLQI